MFKKNLLVLCVLLVGVLFFGSQAGAVSFTAVGTDVDFGGLAFGDYDVTPISQDFTLGDGDSTTVNLFDVTFTETSGGIGMIEATIDLIEPDEGVQTQDGSWFGFAAVTGSYNFITGVINWGSPVSWDYNLGSSWGTLTLDLLDMEHVFCNTISGNDLTIAGIFTNVQYDDPNYTIPAPVPEPATMFLLGTGLVGLGTVSRKKWIKK